MAHGKHDLARFAGMLLQAGFTPDELSAVIADLEFARALLLADEAHDVALARTGVDWTAEKRRALGAVFEELGLPVREGEQ